ncbi:unnamed protein product [Durusdinium trenchii]|uniref:Uncharacterized protein n=2 Tax=Durusdinium trenchii TaxID=1381693 RepID=A0ABP0MY83_9DINO
MSQSIVNEVLAKKPKRRVEWVQKRLKEDLAITHRDSLYEVLVRKEGRAFAADISGADAVRTYNAVLAAIELFTTKQQRHLQADSFLLRKIHTQEQERHKAAQAKAKAAKEVKTVKKSKEAPSVSGLVKTTRKDSPKAAPKGSPNPPAKTSPIRSSSPIASNSAKDTAEAQRSESPDWIPRTPPQAAPQEPRKSTGSWTTIFADGPKDKLSSARESELSTVQKGVKSPKSSSDSTEYDAFATGPEPALKSPRERTEQSEESLARPSGLHAAVKNSAGGSEPDIDREQSEGKPGGKNETAENSEIVMKDAGDLDRPSPSKSRLETDEMDNLKTSAVEDKGTEATRSPEKSPVDQAAEPSDMPAESTKGSRSGRSGSGESETSEYSASEKTDPGAAQLAGPLASNVNDGGCSSDTSPATELQAKVPRTAQSEACPTVTRQPPPPPLARRRSVEIHGHLPHWKYIAADGEERLPIRSSSAVDAPTTGGSLGSGEVFAVEQETPGANGVLFLRLADGRGWVFDRKSGLGRKRRARPLCVPYQVPLIDEEDGTKTRKARDKVRKACNGPPKAKRRRHQAVHDPYMVETADIIEVESDEGRPLGSPNARKEAPANEHHSERDVAKEQLRVQLEKKQQEVQALRAKLSQLDAKEELRRKVPRQTSPGLQAEGERAHSGKANSILDQKRRELQAMLAKKRAKSMAHGLIQKPAPRFVD